MTPEEMTLKDCRIHPEWEGLIVATGDTDDSLRFYHKDALEAVRIELAEAVFVFLRRERNHL